MLRFQRERLLSSDVPAAIRARRSSALDLAEAALASIEPERATAAALMRLRERGVDLDGSTLFAFGKASERMTRAAVHDLSLAGGIVVALSDASFEGLEVRRGEHPLPSERVLETGREVLALAESLGADDRALVFASGGGSAMLELPKEGVTLEEMRRCTALALERGAAIDELNALRGGLSRLKRGGLALAIAPAPIVNVLISDVPGHPLSLVASGPTLAAPSTKDALAVARRFSLPLSAAAERALSEPPPDLAAAAIETELAADHETAREAVVAAGARAGLVVRDREGVFSGEARELGARLAREAPSAWVWGGETVVTVRGGGRGGRNRELALAALSGGLPGGLLLALGTDGVDGAPGAAGALVDEHVGLLARRGGLSPEAYLRENDSAAFFEHVGAALVLETGSSGTNVADLILRLP